MADCFETSTTRRRLFWATQPDGCGTDERCGYQCGRAGLSYPVSQQVGEVGVGRTIITTDWIRGLIINMMMTDGREPNSACGFTAGAQGGHWLQSYLTDGTNDVGTLIRTVGTDLSVNAALATVIAYAQATLERLIARGVALKVEVDGAYVGSGKIQLNVVVYGHDETKTKVGLDGARLQNGWVWS